MLLKINNNKKTFLDHNSKRTKVPVSIRDCQDMLYCTQSVRSVFYLKNQALMESSLKSNLDI